MAWVGLEKILASRRTVLASLLGLFYTIPTTHSQIQANAGKLDDAIQVNIGKTYLLNRDVLTITCTGTASSSTSIPSTVGGKWEFSTGA